MPTFAAQVGFLIRDERGNEKWFTENAEVTFTDAADLQALIQTIAEDIDAPISGRVIDTKINMSLGVSAGVKPAPQAGSSVYEGARIGIADSEGNVQGIFVPSLTSVARYVDGETLNLADAEVATLVSRLLIGNNVSGSASLDFRDDDNRKYVPYDANNDAKYGTYTTRKPS